VSSGASGAAAAVARVVRGARRHGCCNCSRGVCSDGRGGCRQQQQPPLLLLPGRRLFGRACSLPRAWRVHAHAAVSRRVRRCGSCVSASLSLSVCGCVCVCVCV
jgi:hypothetical protein